MKGSREGGRKRELRAGRGREEVGEEVGEEEGK